MNVIFLSPHFPPNWFLFCAALQRLGVNVLGIGETPYEMLPFHVRQVLTDYFRVDYMEDYQQVLRATAYFTYHYGKIDRIDSHNEHWLDLEAHIRTDFNMAGPKLDTIDGMKLKSLMKHKLLAAGVPVAKGTRVKTIKEARRFLEEVGYPVVVKPDKGVGASFTYKLENEQQLEKFFAEKPPVDFFMEEFVVGTINTFDGLTDRDGKPVFYTSHVMSDGIMEVVNEDKHVAYYSQREIPEDLQEMGFKALKAFDVRERFFHFEFFLVPTINRWVALEVNIRPPGGFTMDMFNYACDIDMYQQWANILVNNQFTTDYFRKYHCCYVGRKKKIPYAHPHEQVMAKYRSIMAEHIVMPELFRRAMGDYAYMIRSPELDVIKEATAYMHAVQA